MIQFEVHVYSGARADQVGGQFTGALVVRTRARALDDAANAAITNLLARSFGVPPTFVHCLRGRKSRRKFFRIDGDNEKLQPKFDELLGAT